MSGIWEAGRQEELLLAIAERRGDQAFMARLRQRMTEEASSVDNGVALIVAERQRQIEQEGWSPEHDAEHDDDDLARAAVCYATPPQTQNRICQWPWAWHFWKPTPEDRVRELVKAGALIAAEIDRLISRAVGGEQRG